MKKRMWRKEVKSIFTLDLLLQVSLALVFALSVSWQDQGDFDLMIFLVSFGLIFIVAKIFWNKLVQTKLGKELPLRIKKWEFLVFGGLTLLILVAGVIAKYPGGVSVDVNNQYTQAVTNNYNNLHPFLHTFFVFKIPQLFHQGLISTTIFQCLIIFAILMYFCYFCRKNFLGFAPTLLALILIIMNPTFTNYSVTPWKDILYSWTMMLSTLYVINIVITKGEWLSTWYNKAFFIIATLGVLCFRHNGIVPFALIYLTLGISYAKSRKFSLVSGGGALLAFFIITGPIYSLAGIGGTGGAHEMMGLMLGQISHYYHYRSNEFSAEDLATLDDTTPLRNWNENYNAMSFNLIKFNHGKYSNDGEEDTDEGVERNKGKLIRIWLDKSLANPSSFVESYLNMTSPIWQSWRPMRETILEIDQDGGMIQKGNLKNLSNRVENKIITYNRYASEGPFRLLFWDVGEGLMVILLALALIIKKAGRNIRAWLPFVMVLTNTGIIMLMITGGEVRFVYTQILCAVPLLIYGLSDKAKFAIVEGTEKKRNVDKKIRPSKVRQKRMKVKKVLKKGKQNE